MPNLPSPEPGGLVSTSRPRLISLSLLEVLIPQPHFHELCFLPIDRFISDLYGTELIVTWIVQCELVVLQLNPDSGSM